MVEDYTIIQERKGEFLVKFLNTPKGHGLITQQMYNEVRSLIHESGVSITFSLENVEILNERDTDYLNLLSRYAEKNNSKVLLVNIKPSLREVFDLIKTYAVFNVSY